MTTLPYLPPELVEEIFNQLPVVKRIEKDLINLTLVSKEWGRVARRMLLRDVRIRDDYHMMRVLNGLIEAPDARELIKAVEILFQHTNSPFDSITRSFVSDGAIISEGTIVSNLLSHLPKLTLLSLCLPNSIGTFQLVLNLTIPLDNLTTLRIELTPGHENMNILRQVIDKARNLQDLSILHLNNDDFLDNVPPLRSFAVQFLLPHTNQLQHHYVIPLNSYIGMIDLAISSDDKLNFQNLTSILNLAGPTLKSFEATTSFTYSNILTLLKLLPNVSTLVIKCKEYIPDNFLIHLPPKVKFLGGIIIYNRHLQYLKSQPQELFTPPLLRYMEIGDVTSSMLSSLPSGITTLHIGFILPEMLLASIQELGREKVVKSLKEIILYEMSWVNGINLTLEKKLKDYGIDMM